MSASGESTVGSGKSSGDTRVIKSFYFAFENGHVNHAFGPLLVLGKPRPDFGHLFVQPVPLLTAVHNPRARLERLSAVVVGHLDLDLRGCVDIPEPHRMVRRPAPRCHDDVVVSLAAIDPRGREGLALLDP